MTFTTDGPSPLEAGGVTVSVSAADGRTTREAIPVEFVIVATHWVPAATPPRKEKLVEVHGEETVAPGTGVPPGPVTRIVIIVVGRLSATESPEARFTPAMLTA